MSDSNDTRVENNLLLAKEQVSLEGQEELIRNLMHRVALDGSKDFNALNYLQGIAASTAVLGLIPLNTRVVSSGATKLNLLIPGEVGMSVVVFDILLSINAASNISFLYSDGTNALATMYAPNPGQGFTMNSIRGKWLKSGSGLFVQSSAAVSYSVDISYALVEG